MIHEAGHALAHFGHDTQTEAETVMRSTSPEVGSTGGGRTTFQRCDEAALQLLWDLRALDGPYANCFDGIAGHGTSGLVTTLSVRAISLGAARFSRARAPARRATASTAPALASVPI